MNYIDRPEYMQRLLDLMGTPDIKIITGVRRSGKSELMKAYIRRITETQPDANIIFVDFFDLKYESLKEYHALYDYIEGHYAEGKQNYPKTTTWSRIDLSNSYFSRKKAWRGQDGGCPRHVVLCVELMDGLPNTFA